MKTTYRCHTCGTEVERTPGQIVGRVFCSRACTHAANSGQASPNKGKRGPESTGWKGGSIISPRGYRLLFRPDHPMADKRGYIAEHRAVVAEVLGRPLESHEHVHHRNGNKLDNRPNNLVALIAPEHASIHRGWERVRFPWSRDSDRCLECGTNEEKHEAKGLCLNCYSRKRMAAVRATGYIAPSRRKPDH